MRIHTSTVAQLLGHEMRFADECEKPGLIVAVGAIRAHLHHTQPLAFNAEAFDAAYHRAVTHGAFGPDEDERPRRDLPPKTQGPLTQPTAYDRFLMAVVRHLRATLKKREARRTARYNAAHNPATK